MTPRTAEQNQALREASRERLLAAALRLFARQGYAATPVQAIAREAGVAQGLLYSHFAGKEDLLRALFRRSMDDVRASFAAAAAEGAGAPLERLVRSATGILRRNLDFWRLSYGVRMQPDAVAALGPDFGAWTGEILAVLDGHFRAAGSRAPAVDAALFFAALDGLCQHYALDPEGYPLDAVATALAARFAPPVTPRTRSPAGAASPASPERPRGRATRPPSTPAPGRTRGEPHGKPRRRA